MTSCHWPASEGRSPLGLIPNVATADNLYHECRAYGQGITVAVLQVEALTAALKVNSHNIKLGLLRNYVLHQNRAHVHLINLLCTQERQASADQKLSSDQLRDLSSTLQMRISKKVHVCLHACSQMIARRVWLTAGQLSCWRATVEVQQNPGPPPYLASSRSSLLCRLILPGPSPRPRT